MQGSFLQLFLEQYLLSVYYVFDATLYAMDQRFLVTLDG